MRTRSVDPRPVTPRRMLAGRAAALAPDHTHDIPHSFNAGIDAVDGGRMDCFDKIAQGSRRPYVQFDRTRIPNYWRYAKHFQLDDRFFSPVYGPTTMEHLWSVGGSV